MFTAKSIDQLLASDSVLLGAVGGPKYDSQPPENRPEKALLRIRSLLGLFANIRPAVLFEQLADASPLKPEIVQEGIDFVVVRELTGGIYLVSIKPKGMWQPTSCPIAKRKFVVLPKLLLIPQWYDVKK